MSVSTKIFESISQDNKVKSLNEAKGKGDYSKSVPANVIANIDKMLDSSYPGARWRIDSVYDDLAIFDWWPEYLSISKLKQMKAFLQQAIKLGFDKYCCFKVGASGCANGMWASDAPTTDGYSPSNCKTIYHSFTPDYSYWDVDLGTGFTDQQFKTIGEVRNYIKDETQGREEMKTVTPDEVPETSETLDSTSIKDELVNKSVSEACAYLNELTGLTFNTIKLNNRQMKLAASEDNYLVVTLNKETIVGVSNINIKK